MRFVTVLLGLVLALAAPAAAQTATGLFDGTASDSGGGALPGVTITARAAETGLTRTAISDEAGRYRLAALPPGKYTLTAELSGFSTVVTMDLALSVGMEFRRDITMQVGNVSEAVSVTAKLQPLVEPTKMEVTAVVSQRQITELPIEGRSALKLALLLPGTSEDGTRVRRPGASVGIGGISLAGTNFIIDNMNNMTLRTGDSREEIPQAAVQEFRVIVSQ